MTAASTYMLVFRTLHILAGIAWGGSIFLMVFFLQPTAKAVGPAAGPFMRELLAREAHGRGARLAATTIVAGGFLSTGTTSTSSGPRRPPRHGYGVALTLGAVSALIAFGIGWFATRPAVKRTLALGGRSRRRRTAAAGLVQELQATQAKARTLAKVNFTFVALAAFFMATARYW